MDPNLLKLINSVTAKRPRTVLQHILKHGQVTTSELKDLYGYDHPPRAARDVRELGIPLKTVRVPGPNGRQIGAYTIDETKEAVEGRGGGRRAFPKALKDSLVAAGGERCAVCGGSFPARALQIDHRVPYEIAGDSSVPNADPTQEFMLLCGSCNRAKSWSCEHCENWRSLRNSETCLTCMWGSPGEYSHIALEERRWVQLNWTGSEAKHYDRLRQKSSEHGMDIEEYIKYILEHP